MGFVKNWPLGICIGTLLWLRTGQVSAGPIYVYREPDGTVRFTSFPPKDGSRAKVFTARNAKFSFYSGKWYRGGKWRAEGGLFRDRFQGIIAENARQHSVGADLIKAVIHVESAFNPFAVSPKGALGLMQLTRENAKRLGVRDPFSPHENVRAGVKWLSMLVRRFDGDLKLALAAYNAGIGAVEKYGGVPPYAETQDYVVRVLQMKGRYQKEAGV